MLRVQRTKKTAKQPWPQRTQTTHGLFRRSNLLANNRERPFVHTHRVHVPITAKGETRTADGHQHLAARSPYRPATLHAEL